MIEEQERFRDFVLCGTDAAKTEIEEPIDTDACDDQDEDRGGIRSRGPYSAVDGSHPCAGLGGYLGDDDPERANG